MYMCQYVGEYEVYVDMYMYVQRRVRVAGEGEGGW